jgi:hypothetical protein
LKQKDSATDSATELQDIEGEAENGNPIIVHELGKSQRLAKCS